MSAEYLEVASLEQVPVGHSRVVWVSGKEIALFNVGGEVYATDDRCLHQKWSLSASKLVGKIVACTAHNWKYDVTTGEMIYGKGMKLNSYPVKVVEGKIFVAIEKSALG